MAKCAGVIFVIGSSWVCGWLWWAMVQKAIRNEFYVSLQYIHFIRRRWLDSRCLMWAEREIWFFFFLMLKSWCTPLDALIRRSIRLKWGISIKSLASHCLFRDRQCLFWFREENAFRNIAERETRPKFAKWPEGHSLKFFVFKFVSKIRWIIWTRLHHPLIRMKHKIVNCGISQRRSVQRLRDIILMVAFFPFGGGSFQLHTTSRYQTRSSQTI